METAVIVIFIVLAVLAFAAVAQQAYLLVKRVKNEKKKAENTEKQSVSVLEILQDGNKVYIEYNGIEDESGEVTVSDNEGGKAV